MGDSITEYHSASRAGIAQESRGASTSFHRFDDAHRARRFERYARDDRAPRAAESRQGKAAWVYDLLRLRPRQPDVEDTEPGTETPDRHGAGGDCEGALRGSTDAGVDRQARRRIQARPVGLAVLLGAGAQGTIRSR